MTERIARTPDAADVPTATDGLAAPHAAPIKDVLAALDATESGLSEEEAQARLARYGPNRLPETRKRGVVVRFLSQFNNLLIYVLLIAAVVTAALEHYIDTGVILAVVVINAIIGFIQEGRAEQAMDAIRQMLSPHTTVLRDGRRRDLDSTEVAPGDIVLLKAGEKAPADMRLIEAKGLRVEEAILTGESVPVEKSTAPVSEDAPLGDRACMAFSGTLVAAGAGRGVVTATGEETEIGRISGLISDVETLTTPLLRQMSQFARWLTVLILLFAGALFVYDYFVLHMPFADLFMAVVGLAVAAIPEGLPAVLTITLAVGVRTMAQRNAIVRRLPAIETLGSVSVICTDKTGTLTRNEMMASSIVTADGFFTAKGDGYAPHGAIRSDGTYVQPTDQGVLGEIARAAALCNDAALRESETGWRAEGDPMEGALMAMAGRITDGGPAPFAEWTRTDSIPFDAAHGFMATLDREDRGGAFIHVKGAPERILKMCADQRTADGGTAPLDENYWRQQLDAIANEGQRVLAIAVRAAPEDLSDLTRPDLDGHITLLGLVGLIDPPRPEAVEAVEACHRAGIRVKMITGDHSGTAQAIARQIGLKNPGPVLTGAEVDALDDAELAAIVTDTDIFARTTPEHKLRLVTALQSHGQTVAMTGDGVNDAPALKRADAGIAMGLKGSEAAKEAAEFVLADDNFASIAAAVREGRTVYDNIKKVISWTLPTNGGEAMTIAIALLFAMALPVTPVQILWVNLVTAVTLGVALAFEPTEEGTMRRPPRPRDEPLLNSTLIWHIAFVSTLFVFGVFGIYAYAIDKGYSDELARTIAVNTLVVLEIFHLFFIRNIYGTSLTWKAMRGTPIVWAAIAIVVTAQIAFTYAPPVQRIFGTEPVGLLDGMLIILVGVVFFAVIESEKQLRLALLRTESGPASTVG